MTSNKFTAGQVFPDISWAAVGGGEIAPARDDGWRLLIVYRGKHCPLCKKYLHGLQGLLNDITDAEITVYAISADPEDRASDEAKAEGWTFPVGYDLKPDQMAKLGLYISEPRSPEETDRPFAEPAVFVINPDGDTQIIDVSNAPFARPDLEQLLDGIKFVKDKGYPIRGTLSSAS